MKKNVIKIGLAGILMVILLSSMNFVYAKEFEKIQLAEEQIVLEQGGTTLLLYSIVPAGADNIENRTWLSHNSEIAEVDENGKITAKKEGTTTIEFVISGKKENGQDYSETAKCEVVVEKKQNSEVVVKENQTQKQVRLTKTSRVEQVSQVEQKELEEPKLSNKNKLILLVFIIGLIVIFILIGTASDKKNGNLRTQKEKGEKRNDKKYK